MLKNTDHCRLCQNHQPNINLGLICKLTEKPPEFNNTCPTIDFDKLAIKRIKDINLKFKKMTESKFDIYGGIILWPFIGILVLISDYFLYKHLAIHNTFSTVTFILFCVGIILIAMGTGPYIQFQKEKKIIISEKNKLDNVFKIYRLKYIINYYPKRIFLDTRIMIKNVEFVNKHQHLK